MTVPRNLFLSALTCVATVAAGAASAGQCGYEYCWGAVGSSSKGAYGWAHSYATEQDAYNSVYTSCEGDCTEIKTFYNSCGAMARASNGAWGWAADQTREIAEHRAIGYCLEHGSNCQVVVWACSK
ncbi:MAG: DUF4189 domain-containing protein [Thalassovita sp.]